MGITIRQLHPHFFGEVSGVDLRKPLTPQEAKDIEAGMDKYAVLLFRNQDITDQQQMAFAGLERDGRLRRPIVPPECEHNAHMYYLLLPDLSARTRFIARLKERGIATLFHYVPLHDSPAGRRYGRPHGTLDVTSNTSDRLVRLPLWPGLNDRSADVVVECVQDALKSAAA